MRVEARVADASASELLNGQPAGSFRFLMLDVSTFSEPNVQTCWLHFICSCGCGDFVGIPVATSPKQEDKWQWDGDREKPTITPSIKRLDHCKWHGHLTAGVWDGVNE